MQVRSALLKSNLNLQCWRMLAGAHWWYVAVVVSKSILVVTCRPRLSWRTCQLRAADTKSQLLRRLDQQLTQDSTAKFSQFSWPRLYPQMVETALSKPYVFSLMFERNPKAKQDNVDAKHICFTRSFQKQSIIGIFGGSWLVSSPVAVWRWKEIHIQSFVAQRRYQHRYANFIGLVMV